jgi:membrane fusion protein (multidrug efflux system)
VQANEIAIREALEREAELLPRHRLAQERAERARQSPTGTISELEKLERVTEVDALDFASRAQVLATTRLRREQAVRKQTMQAELLGLQREELRLEGQAREIKVTIDRVEYSIERRYYRAPATGRLVDVAELGSGAFIADGQRLGTILAADAKVRVRSRFPREVVGLLRPGQRAEVKLDGYPWTIYGTVPARVTRVGTEPGITATPEAIPGTVRVELEIDGAMDPRIEVQHGLTGSVEVEVARASPIALLMRAIGEWEAPSSDANARRRDVFQPQAEAR